MTIFGQGLLESDEALSFSKSLGQSPNKKNVFEPVYKVCNGEDVSIDLAARCLVSGCVMFAKAAPSAKKLFEGNDELFTLSAVTDWALEQADYYQVFDAFCRVLKESSYAKEMQKSSKMFMNWSRAVTTLMYHFWDQLDKGEVGPVLGGFKRKKLRPGDVFALNVDGVLVLAQHAISGFFVFWEGASEDFLALVATDPIMVCKPTDGLFQYVDYIGNFKEHYDREKITIGVIDRQTRGPAKKNLADGVPTGCSLDEYRKLDKEPPLTEIEIFWKLRSIISGLPYVSFGVVNDPPEYL